MRSSSAETEGEESEAGRILPCLAIERILSALQILRSIVPWFLHKLARPRRSKM